MAVIARATATEVKPRLNGTANPALASMARFFLTLVIVAAVILIGAFVFAAFTL
jgi:hypothetical protein